MQGVFENRVILVYREIKGSQMKKSNCGVKPGTVNNPAGKNQWEGVRSKQSISVRFLADTDRALRERAAIEGRTISSLIEEAIDQYLAADNPTKNPLGGAGDY
jgi:hypothetical protein